MNVDTGWKKEEAPKSEPAPIVAYLITKSLLPDPPPGTAPEHRRAVRMLAYAAGHDIPVYATEGAPRVGGITSRNPADAVILGHDEAYAWIDAAHAMGDLHWGLKPLVDTPELREQMARQAAKRNGGR